MYLDLINNLPFAIIFIIIIIFSLCIGSFISFLSFRITADKNIFDIHSKCTNCDYILKFYDLIPVISWINLKAKCRNCKIKISARYPIIELSSCLIGISGYYFYGPTIQYLLWCYICFIFLLMIITDLEHMIVPDSFQIAFFTSFIFYKFVQNINFTENIMTVLILAFICLGLKFGYMKLRGKDGLGWADIKFMIIAGLFLPINLISKFLLLAGIFGIISSIIWQKFNENKIFPFIPALIFAFIICLHDNL